MVKIWLFHSRGTDSVPGQRTEIPQAEQPKKNYKNFNCYEEPYECCMLCSNI